MTADAAAFTGDRIDPVGTFIDLDGVEATQFQTGPATGAAFGQNVCHGTAGKVVAAENIRLEYQMQVGRIDIAIGQHGAWGQGREGGDYRGLSRPPLTADNH